MKLGRDFLRIGKTYVVADLHLGLVRIADRAVLERLSSLADRGEVVVAGDARHLGKPFPLEDLLSLPNVVIVKGNHDAGLEAERVVVKGKYAIFHGHTLPDEAFDAKVWIVGHAHPAVYIDGYKERVFMLGEVEGRKVVVLPSFNELCASTAVNLEKPAGVIFRKWDYSDWDVVLEDGTVLTLRSLRKI
ncbi:MAG: metallophosphoesterase family protein [Archaeoglobaceae archaeon]